MMVGSEFIGDDNRTLMHVQHNGYSDSVARLCAASRHRYLAAARLLQVEDELSVKLHTMEFFDHRTLQSAHDLIAAYYRFQAPGYSQLLLGENDSAYQRRLEDAWCAFFSGEVAELSADDEFTRAICRATSFGNKPRGVAAEKWLEQFLRSRYAACGLTAWDDSSALALRQS